MKDGTFTADRLLALYDRVAEAEDAIPRLRRFVLDLAVRGKLVVQDPTDEPAAELLKRIAKEKARLVKAGEIKKSEVEALPLEDEPHALPQTWVWTRLGSIGDWGAGSTPSRGNSELYGGSVTWLKSGELNDNTALGGSEETVTDEAVKKGSFRVNKPGDVLIAMYGATIGKLAILAETAVTNQAVCGCTPFEGVKNRFLFLFLLSYRANFHAASEGGAQPNISKVKIVNTPFPLPPLAEQQRIVAKVDELMALCDRLEGARAGREAVRDRLTAATLARLTAPETDAETFPTHARFALQTLPALTTRPDQIKPLRQTILNLAVRGKLVVQDPTDEPAAELLKRIAKEKARHQAKPVVDKQGSGLTAFEIPDGWAWTTLAGVSTVTMGQSPPGDTYNTHGEGVPLINGPVEFTEGPFGLTVVNQYTTAPTNFCEKGDLLICVRGSTTGRTNVAAFRACIGRGVAAIHSSFEDGFVRLFLWKARYDIIEMGRGIAFPSVSKKQIEDLAFPLPPLAEQQRIVAKVDELMALCDRLEAALTTVDTTRSRLLEALLHEALEPLN